MKITKYIHACLFLEKDDKRLVIDPGEYSELPNDLSNINTIALTHEHQDHVGLKNIKKIVTANSQVKIFAFPEVLGQLADIQADKQAIETNGKFENDGFELEFIIHDHAVVYETVPCKNVGVIIDGDFYYPGDSFFMPDRRFLTVALPISGPWMKLGEALDFAKDIQSSNFFGTHDAHASEIGLNLAATWFNKVLIPLNKKVKLLKPGESLEA